MSKKASIVEPAVLRAKYSQKEREAMDKSDFGDPANLAFPIKEPEDVIHAAERLHNAGGNQAEIKKRIIQIAKRKGFPLPQTWQEDKDKEEERTVDPQEQGVTASDRVSMYLPITRAVAENNDWIVEGQVTSDVIDTYETIFDYESSKKAFERWRGNVREQHDAKKAVGRGIKWTPNDAEHTIVLRSLISKGAADTWQKIQDGVLTGYSVALKPGYKTKWVQRSGKQVLCYRDFDYAEVSVVDAPGSPKCDINIVRADGIVTDVLDTTETTETPVQVVIKAKEERAGARVSAETRSGLHEVRDHMLAGARKQMSNCSCDECNGMVSKLDPDNDGDVDLAGSEADTDNDAEKLAERVVAVVLQALQPGILRYQALASRFAAINAQPQIDLAPLTAKIEALESRVERLASTESQDSMRTELSALKGLVERIAAQPAAGGPVLNAADKRLATDPQHQQSNEPYAQEARILHELSKAGVLETTRQQTAAAAMMLRPIGGQ